MYCKLSPWIEPCCDFWESTTFSPFDTIKLSNLFLDVWCTVLYSTVAYSTCIDLQTCNIPRFQDFGFFSDARTRFKTSFTPFIFRLYQSETDTLNSNSSSYWRSGLALYRFGYIYDPSFGDALTHRPVLAFMHRDCHPADPGRSNTAPYAYRITIRHEDVMIVRTVHFMEGLTPRFDGHM